MIVSFKCVSKKTALGWSGYVTSDKQNPNEKRQNHRIIGDDKRDIAKYAISLLDYKTCATNIMISFEKNEADSETREKVVNEYLEYLFNGLGKDDYIYNIVEHNDTPNPHYHIQLVKVNLRTQTQLKIYEHKQDLKFQNALCEYLGEKYNLKIPFKNAEPDKNKRAINKYQSKIKRFDNLSENNLKTLNNMQLKAKINEMIKAKINGDELQNYQDVINFIDYLGFKVVTKSNKGYDGYITLVKKEIDKPKQTDKIKLQGTYYGYEYTSEPTRQYTRDIDTSINQGLHATDRADSTRMQELYNQLSKYNKERNERLAKRYKIIKHGNQQPKNIKQNSTRNTSRNHTNDTEFKQENTRAREHDRQDFTNDERLNKNEYANTRTELPKNIIYFYDVYSPYSLFDSFANHQRYFMELERIKNVRQRFIHYVRNNDKQQRERISSELTSDERAISSKFDSNGDKNGKWIYNINKKYFENIRTNLQERSGNARNDLQECNNIIKSDLQNRNGKAREYIQRKIDSNGEYLQEQIRNLQNRNGKAREYIQNTTTKLITNIRNNIARVKDNIQYVKANNGGNAIKRAIKFTFGVVNLISSITYLWERYGNRINGANEKTRANATKKREQQQLQANFKTNVKDFINKGLNKQVYTLDDLPKLLKKHYYTEQDEVKIYKKDETTAVLVVNNMSMDFDLQSINEHIAQNKERIRHQEQEQEQENTYTSSFKMRR